MRSVIGFIISLAIVSPIAASAQALATTDYSANITPAVVQCVPADSSRKTLFIENPVGNSANICYAINATPTCSAAGTSVLTPGNADFFGLGMAPREAVNCVASGAVVSATIRSQK